MKRNASAIWQGGIKEGSGSISTHSGVLDGAAYGFNTRFEDEPGTNPEELIGAAHAGCFSMALSLMLGEAGITPERIHTEAAVNLRKTDDGFEIDAVHLDVAVSAPGADETEFKRVAEQAKANCPVSKVLNAAITMDARLNA